MGGSFLIIQTMANLGTLWFDTRLKNTAVQDAKRIREKLQSTLGANTKIAFDVNRNALRSNLKQALSNIHPKVKIDVVVNKTSATQAIKQAVSAAQQSDVTTRATNSQTVATQRLAKAQVAAANATNAHSRSMVKLNASFGQGISFSSKLGSTIAGIYSVAMLGRFGAQMIEIGGEFQKQRIALENMLGSLSKADALYARMKGLAVESPFTFKDLMGFTKQLRAFQIPYEEIFDTTKRLADISAGLGVDMNRIILAYGQVRSAAFLRGQEVRQFTEAGIPLLDALAKKFTELEGKVVSVGDVFEKISKRQVSFQMVKDVLWDLTDAGGQFYNMQAKLTESLSGKLDKLRDSYEIAIAEMAQGNNKALGTVLDTFTALAGHLGTVIGLVSSLTGAWLTYRGAMALVNTFDMAKGFAESIRHIIAMRRELGLLKAAQIEFNIAASANVWAGILSGVVLAVGAFMTLSGATKNAEERLREINGDLEEGTTLIKEKSSATQQSIKVLTDETKSEEERLRAYKEINRMYPGLLGNMDFEQAKRANSITLLNAETVATKALLREKLKLQGQRLQEEIADLEKGYDRGKGYSFLGFFHRNEKWQEKQLGDIINAKKALEENQKALEELGKTSEKVAVSNERWRKNANDMAKGFANLTPTSEEDYAQYLDRIKKEYDSVNSELKKRTSSAPDYQSLLNEQKALSNIYFKALGGADEGLKGGGRSSGTDNQLEALKHRVALYKKFFAEFEKARAMYGREGALALMKNMGFGEVFGWGLDDVTNYSISLRKLTQGLSATTEARKNFLNTTDADIVAQGIKEEGDELRQYAEQLDMVLDKMRDGYDTYKRWYELTGNKELAASIAGVSMDRDYAGYLREEMRKSMARAGINEDVDKVLGWDKAKVEKFGKNSIIMKFWNEWQANNKKIRESNLALFEEAIKDAKRYEDKVADINNELERQLTAIDAMTGISDAEKERLKSNRRANAQEQLSKLSWENFKKANDWGRIFGDLDKISTDTLEGMLAKLRELIPQIEASAESTKALYEAMDKIEKVVNERNPFAAISKSLSSQAALKKAYKIANKDKSGAVIANDALARILGVGIGTKVSKEQISDGLQTVEQDFQNGLKGLVDKFGQIQEAINPVIELFDQLGSHELSDFFKMASNSLSSAQSTAGALSSLGIKGAGPYAAIAAGVITSVTSLFNEREKLIQEQIAQSKRMQKAMENLSEAIEDRMGRSLSGIFGEKITDVEKYSLAANVGYRFGLVNPFDAFGAEASKRLFGPIYDAYESGSPYAAMLASLYLQRYELERQIDKQLKSRNPDYDAIQDARQQISELDEQIKYFAIDMAKTLYGIDLKSWAEELTSAVVDAWDRGEDAIDAYHKKAQDMMKDLTSNILTQKIMGAVFEEAGIDELISQLMSDTKGQLNENTVGEIAEALFDVGERSAEAITAILDRMEEKGYIRRGDSDTSSSSTSGSIKSITESTADLLASYINAIRADVSVNRGELSVYLPSFNELLRQGNVIAETQVQLQTQIASNTLRNAEAAEAIRQVMHRIETGDTKVRIA